MFVIAATGVVGAQTVRLPDRYSDQEFWKLINDVSEVGGYFRSDNFLSNERMFQYVIPELQRITRPGGVYLGVGPEQNFTYIVALQPKVAIIFDIRRQNMIEHLMYKALFELASDRVDFLSRLFCRARPTAMDSAKTVAELLQAYRVEQRDTAIARRTQTAVKETLARHGFTLTPDDLKSLDYVYEVFCTAGPDLDYSYPNLRGGFGRGGMPSYADLMTMTDGTGAQRSYLTTEANYRLLRSMQQRNLIVPVVGDFAGPKAIRAVAQYLESHNATVTAFYTSNVEQYLFQQDDEWRRFYENVATLPLDSSSTFIRSVAGARGFVFGRLGSVISSMPELVKAYKDGRILTYADIIQLSR